MLMEVKNQFRVSFLTIKYALIREMLNKTTFFMNIVFMILNNASFIIQMLILFSLKEDVGGYTFKQMLLLWGISASTFGVAHFFFKKAFSLSDVINNGKLDSFLVQPKNVLISTITTDIETSAIGDLLYGFIILCVYGLSLYNLSLFIFFSICGGLMLVSIAVILGSLSFWFKKTDIISDTLNSLMIHFSTYPDGIFKGLTKIILFTILPVGFTVYIPVHILSSFDLYLFLMVIGVTILLVSLAFFVFYRGLRRYSSSNLMIARI